MIARLPNGTVAKQIYLPVQCFCRSGYKYRMVRLKRRWFLVRVETTTDDAEWNFTKREFAKNLRESLEENFGLMASCHCECTGQYVFIALCFTTFKVGYICAFNVPYT